LFERTLKGVGAPPPPNPNKRPEPVETDPRAIDMRARLDALEFERTKNRKHLEAQATLRGQLKVVSGRTKEEPPTEVRTGHLKLVR
jgi:hypothetical protein